MVSSRQPEVVAMSVKAPTGAGRQPDPVPIAESMGWSAPGVRVLVAGIVMLLAGVVLLALGVSLGPNAAGPIALIWAAAVLIIAGYLAVRGLTSVVAGEARVIQLFGRYRGTVRAAGLHWVNPFARRRKLSVRIRNHETALAKVNDADGNPIEIAAVVVWQVKDTAQALYAVDDFIQFVAIQTETAVRHIASSYPDTSGPDGGLSLRDNADEITQRLSDEIAVRIRPAGGDDCRVAADPAVLRPGDRPGHAAPAAGERRGRGADTDRRGSGGHGATGAAAATGGGRGRTGRGAEGRHGVQPARGAVQRAGHPAGRQHRFPLPVTALPVTAGTVTR